MRTGYTAVVRDRTDRGWGHSRRPHDAPHLRRAEGAGVGRAERVVAEHPPARRRRDGRRASPTAAPGRAAQPTSTTSPGRGWRRIGRARRRRRAGWATSTVPALPPFASIRHLHTLPEAHPRSSVGPARTITFQGGPMRTLSRILRPRLEVSAHCDLPCGVYDPAQARIEAESVKAVQEKYQAQRRPALPGPRHRHQGAARRAREAPPLGAVERLLQAPALREVPGAAPAVQRRHQGPLGRQVVDRPGHRPEGARPTSPQIDKIFWETKAAS